MELCVIGLGKLGLCTALCFAKAGFYVYGVDIDKRLVEKVKNKMSPFYEPGLDELLKRHNNISFSTDFSDGVLNAKVIFIIVPTPSIEDGSFTNRYIKDVFKNIAPFLRKREDFVVIDIVSTVMPCSADLELIPFIEELTSKKVPEHIGYIYNPEFIAIGSVIRDFLNPDLVLIGESDKRSGDIVEDIYKKTCENSPFIARTSIINAEIAKLSINCFCTMKISFANFLAELVDNLPGADAKEITKIIGKDSRIGEKYISPGLGFGGPCFPRDNEAFINFAKRCGKDAKLQKAVVDINNFQISRAVIKIVEEIRIRKKESPVVALLGLAYKPYTYLTERAQQLEVAKHLAKNRYIKKLKVYDPLVEENYGWEKASSLQECIKDADIVAILTPYPEFVEVNRWIKTAKEGAVIINFWG